MPLAKGDQLQLKANAPSLDGKELINGELVTVKAVNPNGRIELKDGRVLPEKYREFVRGYGNYVLRVARQTVEHVLFSDSSVKAATNNQHGSSRFRGERGRSKSSPRTKRSCAKTSVAWATANWRLNLRSRIRRRRGVCRRQFAIYRRTDSKPPFGNGSNTN